MRVYVHVCASLYQEGCENGRYVVKPKITLLLWVEVNVLKCAYVYVHAIYIIDFLYFVFCFDLLLLQLAVAREWEETIKVLLNSVFFNI